MTNIREITGLIAASRRRALSGCAAAVLLSLAMGALPAAAQTTQDQNNCANARLNPDAAIAACSALLRTTGESAHNIAVSYLHRGAAWEEKGDHDRAIGDFSQAIVVNPGSASAFHGRGIAYGRKGDTDRAIADLGRAIQLNPNLVSAYTNRAHAYTLKGQFDLAIADANAALRINPGFAPAYVRRGAALAKKGQTDAALADVNNALRLDPRSAMAHNLRGTIEMGRGRLDTAIASFEQAIRLDPKSPAAYANRGQAFEQQNRKEAALADFATALRIDQNHQAASAGRARINAQQSAAPVAPITTGLAPLRRPADPMPATPTPAPTMIEAPGRNVTVKGGALTGRDNTGVVSATEIAPATRPAAPPRSLTEALAACARTADDGSQLFIDTEEKTRIAFPACYRGRSHLECTMKVLVDEAAEIDREYGEIVRANYAGIKDVGAVCRLPAAQLDLHLAKAKGFDARVNTLTKAFQSSAACIESTADVVRKISLRTQKNSDELMQSMLTSIREPVVRAEASHREVLKLVANIADSQQSITTVRNVRKLSCR